jgi:hypothetical protein
VPNDPEPTQPPSSPAHQEPTPPVNQPQVAATADLPARNPERVILTDLPERHPERLIETKLSNLPDRHPEDVTKATKPDNIQKQQQNKKD